MAGFFAYLYQLQHLQGWEGLAQTAGGHVAYGGNVVTAFLVACADHLRFGLTAAS
jgi:hypothetical protein